MVLSEADVGPAVVGGLAVEPVPAPDGRGCEDNVAFIDLADRVVDLGEDLE